jgi:actin-like ATPase involved in cell morphogenesis
MGLNDITITIGTLAVDITETNQTIFMGASTFTPSGWELLEAMMDYLKTSRGFLVARLTAHQAILEAGSALPTDEHRSITLQGRNMENGLPSTFEVTTQEIQEVIGGLLDTIVVNTARKLMLYTLSLSPGTTLNNTITLCGDFRGVRGLAARLEHELRANIMPDATVVIGKR